MVWLVGCCRRSDDWSWVCWDGQTNWMDSTVGCWRPKSRARTDMWIGLDLVLDLDQDRSRLCRMKAIYTTIDNNRGRDAS